MQVGVSSPGILNADFTKLSPTRAYRAAASNRSHAANNGPQIARVRKVVSRAGTLNIPLKLNTAAARLLKQKKHFTVSLRLSFTRKGGQKVTRTQRVTITAPQAPPRTCRGQKPKKLPTKGVGCLARQ